MIGEEVIAVWDDGIDGAELFEVAELVRCRDCKHVTYKINPVRTQDVFYACPYSEIQHDGDFYCAYGERIDNE